MIEIIAIAIFAAISVVWLGLIVAMWWLGPPPLLGDPDQGAPGPDDLLHEPPIDNHTGLPSTEYDEESP